MPPGRQKYIKAAYNILKQKGHTNKDSYRTYIAMLKRMVHLGKTPSVLDAEMTLFANGPKVAEVFIANDRH